MIRSKLRQFIGGLGYEGTELTARASLFSTSVAHPVALVSVTVTARAIVFTDARCPNCGRLVMAIPGTPLIEVRPVRNNDDRSGRGRVVKCNRGGCQSLLEVIEHQRPAVA